MDPALGGQAESIAQQHRGLVGGGLSPQVRRRLAGSLEIATQASGRDN
jgi:hypothetical protein